MQENPDQLTWSETSPLKKKEKEKNITRWMVGSTQITTQPAPR